MALLTRRQLLESPAAVLAGGEPIEVRSTAGTVRAGAPDYTWEWSAADDTFRLRDSKGRVAASGKLQPAIVTVRGRARVCTPGRVAGHEAGSDSLTVRYGGVNGGGGIGITLRFQASGIWFEPVVYESTSPEDVVDLRYFAEGTGDDARPALACRYVVMPGINEGTAVSPILTADTRLNVTNWLGRGSLPAPGLHQQWGLPAHFFCGFERGGYGQPGALTTGLSGAFCCGLAGLPAGDLFLQTAAGRHSLIVSVRSDLWHHARGPARLSLGAKLLWTMGSDFREAIRAYYLGLEREGAIRPKRSSPRKSAAMLSPQFNTWGAQVATGKAGARLDEASLNQLYADVRRAGMKPGMFVIDDKWEGKYGNLEHSAGRLPHFEEFLERVRRDGLRTGLWAAFMRCEDPRDLGLAPAHMLRGADGKPIRNSGGWYLLDFTQPEVQTVLRERARRFARRYRPDLIKFDFGYELPPLATAAPKDMSWAGERMLLKGLEVVVGALREENPDIVVMYYSLSPLLLDYIDLHSPDDLYLCSGEYDVEANRRFWFSSLLGELGVPTYGSGGYDWISMPQIWFDSALAGTLGSLQSFRGDERDSGPSPERVAKYNGLSRVLRRATRFRIEPVGEAPPFAPTRGAHASSWARYEGEELVGVALRGACAYRDLVRTSSSVVLTSLDPEGLARARRLGAVPYGDGELALKRTGAASRVVVKRHLFGGAVEDGGAEAGGGSLRLPFQERAAHGAPVEWIEITVE